MQIEELNKFAALFDIYGKLLSKTQHELMSEFLNFNLSETELAESAGSSRQSVHDAITKAKKQLLVFEEKCGVLKSKFEAKEQLLKLRNLINDNLDVQKRLDDIIDNI